MLRSVLAVLVAAALLGIALPVVDDARVAHADSQVRTELDHLESVALALRAESDPTRRGVPGARIERTVSLPVQTWGKAGLQRLAFPAAPDGRVTWRVQGGGRKTTQPTPPLVAPPGGLTLETGGPHRLRLTLTRRAGERVVVVSRADV